MPPEDTSPTPSPAEEPDTLAQEAPAPEVVASGPMEQTSAPVDGHVVEAPLEPQTAQIPLNEPFEPAPATASAESSGATAPEPPPVAASAPVTNAPITTGNSRDMFVKARATIQERKQKKLDRIMEALHTEERITNDEVEKLLHVSDATATRYLSALEKDGKIKQVGKTGIAVVYTKI